MNDIWTWVLVLVAAVLVIGLLLYPRGPDHHHAGLQGDDVVAVVPLLALLLVGVSPGLDHLQLVHAEGAGDG